MKNREIASSIIRILLTIVLIVLGVYPETGIYTAIALFLVMLYTEAHAFQHRWQANNGVQPTGTDDSQKQKVRSGG